MNSERPKRFGSLALMGAIAALGREPRSEYPVTLTRRPEPPMPTQVETPRIRSRARHTRNAGCPYSLDGYEQTKAKAKRRRKIAKASQRRNR